MSPIHARGPGGRRALLQFAAAGLVAGTASGSALAATMVANQPTSFDAIASADSSLLTGTVIDQSSGSFQTTQFCCAGFTWSVNGTITTKVVKAADGTIDFYWQVETAIADYAYLDSPVTPFPEAWNISDLYLRGFWRPDMSFRAGYLADGDGEWAPDAALVHDASYPDWFLPYANGTIDITIQPTTGKSKWFFLDTDADAYQGGAGISAYGPVQWRLGSQEVAAFAPTMMPEPQGWLMLMAGLLPVARLARAARRWRP